MAKETTRKKVIQYKKVDREHFEVRVDPRYAAIRSGQTTLTFGNSHSAKSSYRAMLHVLVSAGKCDQKGWAK